MDHLYSYVTFWKNFRTVPQNITFSNACKISPDIAVKSWQRKWNESNTGKFTYELIPNHGPRSHGVQGVN